MLFDLRGRRQTAVKVIYAMLAVLMGGGLVFFGIGGSVSGGLLDAFTGGNQVERERPDRGVDRHAARRRSRPQPKNEAVAARRSCATTTSWHRPRSRRAPRSSRPRRRPTFSRRRATGSATSSSAATRSTCPWPSLAGQLYGPEALNQPAGRPGGLPHHRGAHERRERLPATDLRSHDRGRQENRRPRDDQGSRPRAERTAQGGREADQGDQETGAGAGGAGRRSGPGVAE